MTVREVPKSYRYTCDKCGAEHVQENAGGQYTNGTPPGWMSVRLWKGADCRDNVEFFNYGSQASTVDVLLCGSCRLSVVAALLGCRVNQETVIRLNDETEKGEAT